MDHWYFFRLSGISNAGLFKCLQLLSISSRFKNCRQKERGRITQKNCISDESYISKGLLNPRSNYQWHSGKEGNLINNKDCFRIELVKSWEKEPIIELYKIGGWWKENMDANKLPELIRGSYLFAVAVDVITERTIGMARVISDGTADAYIQDLVVLPAWRQKGVGEMIVSKLLEHCRSRGISWIGLIAQPGTDGFYRSLGFKQMEGYMPMLFRE